MLHEVEDQHLKLVLSMDDESYGTSFDGVQRENIISWLLK